jgi:hypothetical protein
MSHTKGPWTLRKCLDGWVEIDAPLHMGFARVVWRIQGDDRSLHCEANAHLLKAAPLLLAALEAIVNDAETRDGMTVEQVINAREAIAEAKGE